MFYGDKNNWWACYAFWVFKLFGHEKCFIMDGGRKRWELDNRPLVRDPEPHYSATEYQAKEPDLSIRAFRDEVLRHQRSGKPLVDVRSPGEYTGQLLHMPDYPQEGALRGGHIPGAVNIPWAKAANEDGTFRSAKELENAVSQGKWPEAPQPRRRLLPHRRAVEPHLVRAALFAWVSAGEELRWIVDRMGQRGRPADRTRRTTGAGGTRQNRSGTGSRNPSRNPISGTV